MRSSLPPCRHRAGILTLCLARCQRRSIHHLIYGYHYGEFRMRFVILFALMSLLSGCEQSSKWDGLPDYWHGVVWSVVPEQREFLHRVEGFDYEEIPKNIKLNKKSITIGDMSPFEISQTTFKGDDVWVLQVKPGGAWSEGTWIEVHQTDSSYLMKFSIHTPGFSHHQTWWVDGSSTYSLRAVRD